jgi:hypothetical protein
VLPAESKHTWLAITIYEGKQRQIHRMLEALGYSVDKLQRVAFANLSFHDLRVGDARELTQAELNDLRDLVQLPRGPVARGSWSSHREDTDIPRRARAKAEEEKLANQAAVGGETRRIDPPRRGAPPEPRRGPPTPPTRGPARSSRGPARSSRGPARPSRGPAKPSRGPAKPSRGYGKTRR